jgi:hypothetical protein
LLGTSGRSFHAVCPQVLNLNSEVTLLETVLFGIA